MYSRPKPLFKPVQSPPAVLDERSVRWARWDMGPIAKPKEAEPVPIDEEALRKEAQARRHRELEAELAMLREDARQEGYSQGLEQGLTEGRAQGHTQGHKDGYAAGMARATSEQERIARELATLLASAQREIIDLREEIGQALVSTGVRIASHVLGMQLADPAPSVLATVKQILSQNEDAEGPVTFYLHELDLQAIAPLLPAEQPGQPIRLVADPELTRGDVKARTAYGDIDATLKTRWDAALASIGLQQPLPKPATAPRRRTVKGKSE